MITKKIADKIKEYDKIFLHRHINPDGDAYGVQFGLKHLILENFPEKQVFVVGENLLDLDYIGKCDKVFKEDYKNSLVIIGDCANKERIDGEFWNEADYVIKIDHHPSFQGSNYANLEWIDDICPSASEMVAKLAIDNNWKINKNAARVIFHGMVTDTGRFLYSNLKADTFYIVARLFETKFDYRQLYSSLYKRTLRTIDFEKYILNNFQVSKNGLAFLKNTPNELKYFNITQEKANSFVNILSNIEGIYVWLFASQNEDDEFIKISIRSSKIKINYLASKYGGGGHNLASGVKVKNWTEVDNIINDLDLLIKNSKENQI